MKNLNLGLLSFFSFISIVEADEKLLNKIQLGFNSSVLHVETQSSSSSYADSTSFGTIDLSPSFLHFFGKKSALSLSYNKSLSGRFESSGTSLGYRYYFKNGVISSLKLDNKLIYIVPAWSPFATASYKLATISANDGRLDFEGFEIDAGTDYQLNQHHYLSAKLCYAMLSSGSIRTSKNITFGLAIGRNF